MMILQGHPPMPPKARRLLPLLYPPRIWEAAESATKASEWSSPEPEGNMGMEPRRGLNAGDRGEPHSSEAGKVAACPTAPSPARPPRPRAGASRRRKCCVVHFRVLSGSRRRRRRRASRISRPLLPPPPPPPPLPPQILEPGATSPPWPASKGRLGGSVG
ncbi:leptin receptor overlapping transcript-like 1 isoform X1 [Prionailurus viverrinus]|uniref:leptin receptor overlapping transcript-like 1 isoform X1 n=1 Tax=Prionailurus viverrinus TaxID=61388 RepID=UPI001FF2B626|nr:leptin receptor overlapping transcript-like 1 isoform X1 [Prionailurus viverrinus]